MAAIEKEYTFEASIQDTWNGLVAYSAYPEFLPGVTQIEVLGPQEKGSSAQVRYDLKIIKNFFYTLNMFEEEPNSLSWTLAESNIMKKNNGAWQLKKNGEKKTKAVYTLDIDFKGLVPSRVVDQIAKANIGPLMTGMQRLIDATAQR